MIHDSQSPASGLGYDKLKIYRLSLTHEQICVVQNTLRKMIEVEKIVAKDSGLKPQVRAMRQRNVVALEATRQEISDQCVIQDLSSKDHAG